MLLPLLTVYINFLSRNKNTHSSRVHLLLQHQRSPVELSIMTIVLLLAPYSVNVVYMILKLGAPK
jgi:hypothetical protein